MKQNAEEQDFVYFCFWARQLVMQDTHEKESEIE